MTDNVIPFRRKEIAEVGHLNGPALCLACRHEWVGVAPVGTQELECPSCKSMKGIFTKFVAYADVPNWRCSACEGFMFTVLLLEDTPTLACIGCGVLRNAIDLWNK